jgi:hypothetical protein
MKGPAQAVGGGLGGAGLGGQTGAVTSSRSSRLALTVNQTTSCASPCGEPPAKNLTGGSTRVAT